MLLRDLFKLAYCTYMETMLTVGNGAVNGIIPFVVWASKKVNIPNELIRESFFRFHLGYVAEMVS